MKLIPSQILAWWSRHRHLKPAQQWPGPNLVCAAQLLQTCPHHSKSNSDPETGAVLLGAGRAGRDIMSVVQCLQSLRAVPLNPASIWLGTVSFAFNITHEAGTLVQDKTEAAKQYRQVQEFTVLAYADTAAALDLHLGKKNPTLSSQTSMSTNAATTGFGKGGELSPEPAKCGAGQDRGGQAVPAG